MSKVILSLVLVAVAVAAAANITPQSVKLAFTGSDATQMQVTWFTQDQGSSPSVQYASSEFDPTSNSASGISASIQALNAPKWSGYVNTATITALSSQSTYFYSVGDKKTGTWSPVYNFTTGVNPSTGEVTPFTFVTYGDMGATGGDSATIGHVMDRISTLGFALHVGDIAYADTTDDGVQSVWDSFLTQVNDITSHIPYMVCPGNHDTFANEEIYLKTFNMPSSDNGNAWYSYDYNGVHFIGFSTEDSYKTSSDQFAWIEKDLKAFRASNPNGWVVAFAHRPMYCSSSFGWCSPSESKRNDLISDLESVFFKYNVDLFIAGHSHSYERTMPTYNNQVQGDYSNPQATIHVTIGTAGNQEGLVNGWIDAPVWSTGQRLEQNGYGIVNVANATHMQWQFILDSDNSVADEEWIVKNTWKN
eukprot:gene20365-24435_t